MQTCGCNVFFPRLSATIFDRLIFLDERDRRVETSSPTHEILVWWRGSKQYHSVREHYWSIDRLFHHLSFREIKALQEIEDHENVRRMNEQQTDAWLCSWSCRFRLSNYFTCLHTEWDTYLSSNTCWVICLKWFETSINRWQTRKSRVIWECCWMACPSVMKIKSCIE